MAQRHNLQPSLSSASKIIGFVFLYLIGLSLVPMSASAGLHLFDSSPGTAAAATGPEDPAR